MSIRRNLTCLLLAVLSVGCTSSPESQGAHRTPPVKPVSPVDPRDVLLRPKDFFDDTQTIVDVTLRLTQECMQDKGFRYDGLAESVDRIQGELDPDMDFREMEGFGFAHYYRPLYQPPDDLIVVWDRAISGDPGDSVRWRTLGGSGGSDAGGCFGAAKKRVAGSVLDWTWAVTLQQDYWLIFSHTLSDEITWRNVVAKWAACMHRSGWPDIDYPDQPRNTASARYLAEAAGGKGVTEELRAFEIDLAVDDARCRRSTGVVEVSRTLREDFLESATPEYLRDLRRIAAARTDALRTIRTQLLD
jgi:hypothetical protein